MSVLVLDTDVASLSIKGRLSRSMEARLARSALVAVSFATVGELVQWTEMYDWAPKRKDGVTGVPLATRNVKHFEDFAVHHGLHLITD